MKHTDLVESVIRYCLRAARYGHWHLLRDIGLGEDEIHILLNFRVQDLIKLEDRLQRGGHPVHIRIDRSAFRHLLEEIQRQGGDESTRIRLIQAGAPHELLQRLYGMSTREYARLRSTLDLPPAVGRPAEPDEETVLRISQAWDAAGHEGPHTLTGEDWLALGEAAQCDLRTVYRVVLRWSPASIVRLPRARCKPPRSRQTRRSSGTDSSGQTT